MKHWRLMAFPLVCSPWKKWEGFEFGRSWELDVDAPAEWFNITHTLAQVVF